MFIPYIQSIVAIVLVDSASNYESWVVPAGVPSALADIGGGVEANY